MQKNIFVRTFFIGLVFFITSCSTAKKHEGSPDKSSQLSSIVEDYFESYLKLHPLVATQIGDRRYDDQLTIAINATERAKQRALDQGALAQIKTLGCEGMNEQDSLTCQIFTFDLETALALDKVTLDHLLPFDQFDSFFSEFAELASGSSYISFENETDYRNFMKRAKVVPGYFDAMIENMREGLKKKVTTPGDLVKKALKQVHSLLTPDYKLSPFYKPVAKLEKISGDAALKKEYEELIQHTIYPAYKKLAHFVRTEYLPHARASHGINSVPGGRAFYQALVKSHTTTNLKPEQIHQIGLNEVARIRKQFEEVKTQMKFKGSLKAFFTSLRNDPKLYPFHTEEEVLSAYRALHQKVMNQVPEHFHLMPKAKFEIREVEKFKAENASEAYQQASGDGSRPGIFWVPIPKPSKYPAKGMESLFLHEAIPGHHFQISIQQELSLPRYRRFNGNNAYIEGWALYTESLGKELGMYSDPYQWIGKLEAEMHRAIRLVVDTGMHAKGWSREKAIQYSMNNEPGDAAGIIAEIERYVVIPGQALSYKLGELKIQELKIRAKTALKERYSDRAFHDEILKDGALPLAILERKVDAWIHKSL